VNAIIGWCLVWGLVMGFSHCIGMCGIFILGVNTDCRTTTQVVKKQAMFQTGRLISFAVIGTAVGAIGSLAGFASHYKGIQAWAGLAAGTILAALSIGQIGLVPALRLPEPDVLGLGGGWGRRIYARTLRSRQWWQPFVLGIFVGFLPCGLTYTAAIAAAGTLNAGRAALVMVVFCLSTMPGLVTLALSQSSLLKLFPSANVRLTIGKLSGWVMAAMATAFLIRSIPLLRH
jgi:uncharacterized protein